MSGHPLDHLAGGDVVLDSLPEEVEESIRAREQWLKSVPRDSAGLEFFVSDVRRWTPGQKVRVAFLGGNAALHRDIADATQAITDACNLKLDFGLDPSTGAFRAWSSADGAYAAEVRVSFDKAGYFSLVGMDSVDPDVGPAESDVGGRPGQCSLNLGGFATSRPAGWQGVVRHEFLHAMSFQHSHQNMRGPCEQAFRWEDDAGYTPTKDARGAFVADARSRRPGVYTYLSGYPNFWSKGKVDRNLRTTDDPLAVAGPFDSASVMLYRFPALFYADAASPCVPTGDGITLSEGDLRGLRLLYPASAPELAAMAERRRKALATVESAVPEEEPDGLETGGRARSYARHVAALLTHGVAGP